MAARPVAPADTGLKIDYGHGPQPATWAQLDRTLTVVVAMQKRRAPIVVHAPAARPRERRTQATTKRSGGRSRDGPEPDLPAPRLTRAQRQYLRYELDRRRRDLLRREVRLDLESGAP